MMKLLDAVKERYSIKNDAELSRTLDVPPPTISKIRSGRVNVSADMILRIHECLGMPVADIRSLL
jgi:plasmid maintenance system antidote protein VapI